MSEGLTYEQSGVSIKAQDRAIEGFRDEVERSHVSALKAGAGQVLAGVGSFGAAFAPNTADMPHPVLVSSTDGIGTKVRLHARFGTHAWAGQDLVSAVVNDVLCQGARPLFFLDYLACNKVEPSVIEQVVGGMARTCTEIGSALIGGEIAEMGDTYRPGEYDLAGFAVGAVDRDIMWGAEHVKEGDVLIGLASSGVHCNGFSLVRRLFEQRSDEEWRRIDPELGGNLHDSLLKPTICYARAIAQLRERGLLEHVHAAAHISGGGIPGNLPRSIPNGLQAGVNRAAIRDLAAKTARLFDIIRSCGSVSEDEMWRVFNMGVGFVLIVSENAAAALVDALNKTDHEAMRIGDVGVEASGTKLIWTE